MIIVHCLFRYPHIQMVKLVLSGGLLLANIQMCVIVHVATLGKFQMVCVCGGGGGGSLHKLSHKVCLKKSTKQCIPFSGFQCYFAPTATFHATNPRAAPPSLKSLFPNWDLF